MYNCLKLLRGKLLYILIITIILYFFTFLMICTSQPIPEYITYSGINIKNSDTKKNYSEELQIEEIQLNSIEPLQPLIDDSEVESFAYSNLRTPTLEKSRTYSSKKISCMPKLNGYSESQEKAYFPSKHFPDCKGVNTRSYIKVISNQTISIECPNINGKYLLSSHTTELLGRHEYKIEWLDVINNKIIDLKGSEFVMVKCSNVVKDAYLYNIFNKTAADRAEKISKELKKTLNSSNDKPFGLHIIMLDSVSRPHFYRSFKETISYLNSNIVNSNDYIVYDFLTNNAHGENTRPNLVSMLLGRDFKDHEPFVLKIKDDKIKNLDEYIKIQENSIWKHYEKLGYVTMFGYDTVWNFFSDDSGSIIYTDSRVLNFWNAAKNVFGYADFITKQRCFGQKNAHRYLLDYQVQFNNNYKNHNKFSYIHISVAHENSGTVVKTLDKDIKENLQEIIKQYQDNNQDFLIVFAGDHGRKVNEWDFTDEGILENKHPFHLIITKKDVISNMGEFIHSNIMHNTERLVGRFDWHVTLKQIAHYPYENLAKDSAAYQSYKNSVPTNNAVSVFLEKIPNNRQCADVNIDPLYCLCRDYAPIDISSQLVTNTLTTLAKDTLYYINGNLINDKICKRLSLNTVLYASELILKKLNEGGNRHFKLIFSIEEDKNTQIEIKFYAAEQQEIKRLKKNFGAFPSVLSPGPYLQNYIIGVEDFYIVGNKFLCGLENNSNQAKVCVC